jgi:hypothetical protein
MRIQIKYILFILLSFVVLMSNAQVGINTTTPNAQLEIKSSDQANPTITDGLIIPKIDVFPSTNPTAAQQGMMVYLTTTSGVNLPGFYYWDGAGWKSVGWNRRRKWFFYTLYWRIVWGRNCSCSLERSRS